MNLGNLCYIKLFRMHNCVASAVQGRLTIFCAKDLRIQVLLCSKNIIISLKIVIRFRVMRDES